MREIWRVFKVLLSWGLSKVSGRYLKRGLSKGARAGDVYGKRNLEGWRWGLGDGMWLF